MSRHSNQRQRTRNSHWVPQGYLRAFAAEHAPTKIWRFSHTEGDAELKRIDKVAYKHHLYSARNSETGRRDDALEKKLADLEQWFGSPLWKALQTDIVDLSWEPLRKMTALLMAVMMLRNPRTLEQHREMHRKLVELYSLPMGVPDRITIGGRTFEVDREAWPEFRDGDEEYVKRIWFDSIDNAVEFANMFLSMRWSMLIAPRPCFITSDDPVVFCHPSLRSKGINDPKTSIHFPISPTRVLNLDHLHDEPANGYYPANEDGYTATNLLTWRGALNYIFTHRHPDYVCRELLHEAERQGYA